MYVDPMFYNFL